MELFPFLQGSRGECWRSVAGGLPEAVQPMEDLQGCPSVLWVRDLLLLQLPELLLVRSRSGVPELDADLERVNLFL